MPNKWVCLRAVIFLSIITACSAFGGLTASGPSPTPGQIITDVNTNLTWTAGSQAASHNVYFGTDFDNVNNTGLVGNLAGGEWIDFADVNILADHWLTDSNLPGLVSRWALNGDANDSAGSNNGTVQGDPVWINGIVAGALDLDGNDYIDCGSDSSLDLTNNFSIALWVKMDSGSNILCKGTMNPTVAGGAYSISSDGSSNCIFILRNNTDSAPALLFTPMNFDQWTHIAVTFSNGNMAVYVDGSQANTGTLSTTTVNTNTEPLAIGAEADGGGAMVGSIDDVRIYDNVLSAGDILTIASLPGHGDFDGDGRIDLVDYSMQADNWKKRRDAAVLMGNHDSNSFDPGVLGANDTTYYWRIDEVNGPDVWKGDVWDFVVADKWQMSEFMIMLGWPSSVEHPSPATLIQAMAADNFNTVMWDIGKLGMVRNNGMKLMVMSSDPATAAGLRYDPAVWGYYVADEPWPPYDPGLAPLVEAFHQADPYHPGYINLGGALFDTHPTFIEEINPELLSYDYYQWRMGTYRHFTRLEQYRDGALAAGIPLFCWADLHYGDPYHPIYAVRTRQSVFTYLAYGVKAIQWFNGWAMYELGTTTLKPAGVVAAAINAELKKLGPVLVGLESVDVFHTEPLPDDVSPVRPGHWTQISGGELVLGMFEDSEEKNFAIVANRDIYSPATATLEFLTPVDQVKQFDKSNGQWIVLTIDNSGDNQSVQIGLSEGDGELLSINRLPCRATEPRPVDDETIVDPNVDLMWAAGYGAEDHDVYFGTSFSSVNDANINDVTGIYRGSQTATNTQYDPGTLDASTTYYWRIDTVISGDANSPYKGDVWTFTTRALGIIEDFASYAPTSNWVPSQAGQGWEFWDTGSPDQVQKIGSAYSYSGQGLDVMAPDAGNGFGEWFVWQDISTKPVQIVSATFKIVAGGPDWDQGRFGIEMYGGSTINCALLCEASPGSNVEVLLIGQTNTTLPGSSSIVRGTWYNVQLELNYSTNTIRARYGPASGSYYNWSGSVNMQYPTQSDSVRFIFNGEIHVDDIELSEN